MAPSQVLPFKVGQQAESKSFVKGFRGAWFRCKINKLSQNKDSVTALLEYYDYPGEKKHLTRLYQKPPKNSIGSIDETEAQLILRPCFPSLYRENQMPDLNARSDLVVFVDDVWKVGDLVDWWSDGCYWSGKVTRLLGKDKVQIKLPDPPIGEGKSYEAFCNDLRPSLNWSLQGGWTVPVSETSHCCSRLLQPQIKEGVNGNCTMASSTSDDVAQENCKLVDYGVSASCNTGTSVSSCTLANFLLSPTESMVPHVNGTSRDRSSGGQDNEKEMEVQSAKMSMYSVGRRKELAAGSEKVSNTLAGSSSPLEVNELSGKEETEHELEIQSTNVSLDSGDCGKETTGSFETSGRRFGKDENEKTTKVQLADIGSDIDKSGTISHFTKTSGISCGSFLPPVGCIIPEMIEVSTQSSGMEVTERSVEIQPTSMDLDSDAAGKETTGRFGNSFIAPGRLFLAKSCDSPETNDTSMRSLVVGKAEMGVQPTTIILNSVDGKKPITKLLDKASGSHEVASPLYVTNFSIGKDHCDFRQLSKRLKITENDHPTAVAESNAIESSVLELEELENKIKWLKGLIIFGLQWSNSMKSSWKFSET